MECTERNGFDEPLSPSCPEARISHSEGITQHCGHQPCSEALVCRHGDPRPSYIIGTRLPHIFHAVLNVVSRIKIVAVRANNDLPYIPAHADVTGGGGAQKPGQLTI